MERAQLERKVKEIVSQCLPQAKLENLTLDSEFISLGIDSLSLSRMLVEIEDGFEIEVRLSDIFELKNLRDTVTYLEKRLSS